MTFGEYVDLLFNKHKFVRRLGMLIQFFSIVVIVWVVLDSIVHGHDISEPASSVLIAIIGLNTVYVGLYQWSRERDK